MTEDAFEDPAPARSVDEFILSLDAYEGPIDLLLDQARDQKVDLSQISILALAEQYLEFVERARALRLELAADYLVMAAWLAYLKSRLLLPVEEGQDEPTGAELAAALQFQLRRLEAMRKAGADLLSRDRLNVVVFSRGAPEPTTVVRTPVYEATLYDLLNAYGEHHRRRRVSAATLQIRSSQLYTTDQAVKRLTEMLGLSPGWATLSEFLPDHSDDPLLARSALASTFAASLELAKSGEAELRQDTMFAPVYVRGRPRS
ncbi:MAG: ScpA family protein [Pseudomonadota bacterium]